MDKPEETPETKKPDENQSTDGGDSTTGTHPICQNATDKEKCEEFVEKLDQANENIEKHSD